MLSQYGPATIDLGSIGTIDLVASDLHLDASGPTTATNHSLQTISDTYFSVTITQGEADFSNPTGLLAILAPNFQLHYDFGAAPLNSTYYQFVPQPLGTADSGPGLFSPGAEINLTSLGNSVLNAGGISLVFVYRPDGHFAAVPEAGTLSLLAAPLAIVAFLRLRQGLARKTGRV